MLGIMPNSMFFVKGFFDETRVPKTDVPVVITYDINTTGWTKKKCITFTNKTFMHIVFKNY